MSGRVIGVRSVELGVPDLRNAVRFYTMAWGLEEVSSEASVVYLRGTGSDHHLLVLREYPKRDLLAVHCAAQDAVAVDRLNAQARAFGVSADATPRELPAISGGGYGFSFRTPDGLPITISAGLAANASLPADSGRPSRISHVVLNSAATEDQVRFFCDVLGFKHTDSSYMMEFLRCHADHHSMAIFRNKGPSLNHIAYEVPSFDGLMRGSGRLKKHGFNIEWGVGRHGPGNNIFSYFIDPNGFVTEYTTEVDQIDEATHIFRDPAFWDTLPNKPDRWGLAGQPSIRMQHAMSGALYSGAEVPKEARCEDIIGKTLGERAA